MTKETRMDVQVYSAIGMLAAGVILSVAGFCVPPVGEISDSVLWFFAQCLIYSGSALGVGAYIQGKFTDIEAKLRKTNTTTVRPSTESTETESESEEQNG